MPYSYSHGSVDPGLNAANARVASGTTIPQTSTAGKKGLSLKNMVNAMSKLKQPTGMPFGKAGGRVGSNQLAKFSPIPGLNPNYDYGYGGLDFDPLKRQKKMMGSLV